MVGSKVARQKCSVSAVAVVSACIAAILLLFVSGSAASADESIAWIENRITLLEAANRGYVDVELEATGSIGAAIDMSITSTLNITLAVTINPGLLLGCDIAGVQRLVVRSPVEFNVAINMEASRFIELKPDETRSVGLEAYCLDASQRLPDAGTIYRILGMASAPVERVLRESVRQDEHPGACAIQAAVWIAQENLTKPQFDARLGSNCSDIDAVRAVQLCSQAEIAPDASWLAQAGVIDPEVDQEADSETEPVTDPETTAEGQSEEPSSSIAEWLLLGGLIGFAIILVRVLEGF
ncbi:hypothetical protein JW848_00985 [Candidatus Bipolaricaulota bacterium]|nr:hypothetical protein [Candidatus Bipolaricaulota bacterium]